MKWIQIMLMKYKTILQGLFIQRVRGRNYDISAGQHEPSSGLLRKTRIYVVFVFSILTGNYMKRLRDM